MRRFILCFMIVLASISVRAFAAIPPDEAGAKAALEKSSRHGEWVDVAIEGAKPIRCYIVYPERKEKAGVVIVIHEVFGLTDWIRSVTDQLAADGYIAIAPDLLSEVGGTDSFKSRDDTVKAIRGLKIETVMKNLDAVRDHATKLPAANGKSATVGFCWGGMASFAYAAHQPKLDGAIVYYGTPPDVAAQERIAAPVMGFYGGDDARVTSTVKPTEESMKKLNKKYNVRVYDNAGHGFLRQQDGKDGANKKASDAAWKETLEFLKTCLEAK